MVAIFRAQDLCAPKSSDEGEAQSPGKELTGRRAKYERVASNGKRSSAFDALEGPSFPKRRRGNAYIMKRTFTDVGGHQDLDGVDITRTGTRNHRKKRLRVFQRPQTLADLETDEVLCRCLMEGVVGESPWPYHTL